MTSQRKTLERFLCRQMQPRYLKDNSTENLIRSIIVSASVGLKCVSDGSCRQLGFTAVTMDSHGGPESWLNSDYQNRHFVFFLYSVWHHVHVSCILTSLSVDTQAALEVASYQPESKKYADLRVVSFLWVNTFHFRFHFSVAMFIALANKSLIGSVVFPNRGNTHQCFS